MSAEIIPFRRKPAAPQVNPFMYPVAGYFIGLAIVGLVLVTALDAFMGGDTQRRR